MLVFYFKVSHRKNPETGVSEGYYRLVESYRNSLTAFATVPC
jgi:hypothetical protein